MYREQHWETSSKNYDVISLGYEVFKPLIGITPNTYKVKRFSTNKLISREFAKLGYKSRVTGKDLIVHVGINELRFRQTESSNTSLIGRQILKNKHAARKAMSGAGLCIAKGELFKKHQKKEAKEFALSLRTCVLKPVDGKKGIGVTVGVSNNKDFETAWDKAIAVSNKGILVEEQFIGGIEARYLVVGNKCVAVARRIPPHVIGNGIDTVETLIKKKNKDRKKNPHLRSRSIKVNQHRLSNIRNQGFHLDSIPGKDEIVLIDWKAGFSTGADSYDITEEVHPLFKEIAERVSLIIPGLDIIGVDILAIDHTKEPDNSNYIIIEANTRPGIGGHLYPSYGKPRNVARSIVQHSLSSMPFNNIKA
ncbi:hypothetical protein [Peribacillus deserti]|uniref:ATP-grasp domain-containing protein n=1 Tax=Peribacillus deserti TaxID=673318 RepID=A0A2N5M0E3_9BACI|nr:hypothetical protein [Peribacillus deserti]PLT27785.1 hypothetical protein CUU66_21990 [Peribacillus deserti]